MLFTVVIWDKYCLHIALPSKSNDIYYADTKSKHFNICSDSFNFCLAFS